MANPVELLKGPPTALGGETEWGKGMIKGIGEEVKELGVDPLVAPTPDDLRRRRSKERVLQRKYAKAGRAGTLLTEGNGKLG